MRWFLLTSLLSLPLLWPQLLQARTRVVEVRGERVTLGHVVQGINPRLAHIDLGPTPMPGRSRILTRQQVKERLRYAMVSHRGLRLPMRLRIYRRGQRVDELTLRDFIGAAIKKHLPRSLKLVEVHVRGGMLLGAGDVAASVDLPHRLKPGRVQVRAALNVGHDAPRVVSTWAILARNDQPTAGQGVQSQVRIERGEPVQIIVRTAGVLVKARGTAQQSGRFGDIIAVLPQHARRMLRGRILSDGGIEVMP